MLRLNEILAILQMKKAMGVPFNEGSCFGVTDPRELRPISSPNVPVLSKPKRPRSEDKGVRYERFTDPKTGEILYRPVKKGPSRD